MLVGGVEGEEGAKPKSGLFSLPFMTRAAERQRLNAQQEAAAVLAQLEAEDEQAAAGSDADLDAAEPTGWDSGNGNAGRLAFGAGPAARQQVCFIATLCSFCPHMHEFKCHFLVLSRLTCPIDEQHIGSEQTGTSPTVILQLSTALLCLHYNPFAALEDRLPVCILWLSCLMYMFAFTCGISCTTGST